MEWAVFKDVVVFALFTEGLESGKEFSQLSDLQFEFIGKKS